MVMVRDGSSPSGTCEMLAMFCFLAWTLVPQLCPLCENSLSCILL